MHTNDSRNELFCNLSLGLDLKEREHRSEIVSVIQNLLYRIKDTETKAYEKTEYEMRWYTRQEKLPPQEVASAANEFLHDIAAFEDAVFALQRAYRYDAPRVVTVKTKTKSDVIQKESSLLYNMIVQSSLGNALKNALIDWLKYKKYKYQSDGLRKLIKIAEMHAYSYGEGAVISLIDECIANTWKGIIWDKLIRNYSSNHKPGSSAAYQNPIPSKYYTDDELNDLFDTLTIDELS